MSKVRIYIRPQEISDFIDIKNKDIIHKIRNILRLEKNQTVYIFDGEGKEYIYRIEVITKKNILIRKRKISVNSLPSNKRLILGFPVIREEKTGFILQKATELGVSGFIPFTCERSMRVKSSAKKLQRWHKIVIEAVRQSERLWLPSLNSILDFTSLLKSSYDAKLAASIQGKHLGGVLSRAAQSVLLVVGPEGDFSPEEYTQFKEKGFNFIKLSSHILRTETAAMFGVGLIDNFFLV